MAEPLRILVVCAANICRSPLAETLLRRWADEPRHDGLVIVSSAGAMAEPGAAMCPQAGAWAAADPRGHASRQLTADLIAQADLVLASDREQRAAIARLDIKSGSRLFTLRQAGDLGVKVAATIRAGYLPDGAAPLPAEPDARLRWLVGEFDASRFLLAGRPGTDADIKDAHGPAAHDATFGQVDEAIRGLTRAMDACLEASDLVPAPSE